MTDMQQWRWTVVRAILIIVAGILYVALAHAVDP